VLRLGKDGRSDEKVDWGRVAREEMHSFRCVECTRGKGHRLTSPPSNLRANCPNSAIHVDLWGPARTTSIGGHRYFLTCYDDYSRKISLTFLKKKSEAPAALIKYINLVENQLDLNVKIIHSDRGGEFETQTLKSYLESKGIEHVEVPPAAHAQNGRVERAHLTILNTVRTLLLESGLPDHFWAEAANYVVYARNQSPSGPSKEIPEDLWRGIQVSINHQQPFGVNAYFRDHVETNKLRPRYRPGRLMSYEEGTTNYRVWDIEGKKVIVSQDVVFDTLPESSNLEQTVAISTPPAQTLPDDDTEEDQTVIVQPALPPPAREVPPPRRNPVQAARQAVAPVVPVEPVQPAPRERMVAVKIPTRNRANIEADDNSVESDSESVKPRSATLSPDPIALLGYALLSTGIPDTFRAARQSPEWPEWKGAIDVELGKMAQYRVWKCQRHNAHHVITSDFYAVLERSSTLDSDLL
jgi:transposase InsO family protein